ncbi:Sae3p ASCRUDRAFT_73352 [Ascoidea rubescens DSM 1968]|uniref:Swi5-domain-containing protein n=1 Tax=Ascoidea rubescens DSM 1968 TaxID=1344418 RepID=A0A1D2VPG9_9ASCO|nr:hypothetical protein ASCRUDRAFT_73352 [Ascoidea rubescens DSM 1968]ODV63513.1 hypothetical protein ASCRUDRAFT_73352 [Ascoidea rubescens DSM 1968]
MLQDTSSQGGLDHINNAINNNTISTGTNNINNISTDDSSLMATQILDSHPRSRFRDNRYRSSDSIKTFSSSVPASAPASDTTNTRPQLLKELAKSSDFFKFEIKQSDSNNLKNLINDANLNLLEKKLTKNEKSSISTEIEKIRSKEITLILIQKQCEDLIIELDLNNDQINKPELIIKDHIKKLNQYNELKDIAMGLITMIANHKQIDMKQVLQDLEIDSNDNDNDNGNGNDNDNDVKFNLP